MVEGYPVRLAASYESLAVTRQMMETMKQNQALRGVENYKQRKLTRSTTHQTWRQMKGVQLMMHEMNHPGNKPFVIGFCVTGTLMMYLYLQGRNSEQAKLDSKYYQRFIAKKSTDHH